MIEYENIYVDFTVMGDIKIKTTSKSEEQLIYIKRSDAEYVAKRLSELAQ